MQTFNARSLAATRFCNTLVPRSTLCLLAIWKGAFRNLHLQVSLTQYVAVASLLLGRRVTKNAVGDLQIEGVVPHSISPVSGTAMKQENMSPARPREIIGLNELSEWDYNSSPRQIKRDRSSSLETELYAEVTATAIRNSARNKRRARVKLTRAQQEGLIDLTGDD